MVRVHVWRRNLSIPAAWYGHAALSLGPDPAAPALYISYWPGPRRGEAQSRKSAKKHARGREGRGSESLLEDNVHLENGPDHELDISGLNEDAMAGFWNAVRSGTDTRFDLVEHNCSTVAGGALMRGWEEAEPTSFRDALKLLRWLSPGNLMALTLAELSSDTIWYPRQVLRLAEAIQRVTR